MNEEPKKEGREDKPEIPTLTYKQLAMNYQGLKGKKIQQEVRKLLRNVNKYGVTAKVVNKPGSIITDGQDSYMITKKGKSIKL